MKKNQFNAGKKNQGGAAYNLLNLNYDETNNGQNLQQYDNDCRVRALMRSKNINDKALVISTTRHRVRGLAWRHDAKPPHSING